MRRRSVGRGRGGALVAALLGCAACGPGGSQDAAERPAIGEERALERAGAMLDERPAAGPATPAAASSSSAPTPQT